LPFFRNPSKPETGFPNLEWDEVQDTRPMGQHERPLQARVDMQMAVVGSRHTRVALAIEKFWGHPDCVTYIEELILGGYKEGEKRMGFKPEVVTALMTLIELHKQAHGLQGRVEIKP
jgi:hypothetical protein